MKCAIVSNFWSWKAFFDPTLEITNIANSPFLCSDDSCTPKNACLKLLSTVWCWHLAYTSPPSLFVHLPSQNGDPEAEELIYSHFVICNDTNETLRFGQVDTDENVLLASLHSHQYSWRSHKSSQVLHESTSITHGSHPLAVPSYTK